MLNLHSYKWPFFSREYCLRPNPEILRPEETRLVNDGSPKYVQSQLFIESLLRKTPATDAKIHIAQDAAMDVLPYQLKPARQALEAVRPRILIADAASFIVIMLLLLIPSLFISNLDPASTVKTE